MDSGPSRARSAHLRLITDRRAGLDLRSREDHRPRAYCRAVRNRCGGRGLGRSGRAVERLPSFGGLPITAEPWITQPSPIRVRAWIATFPPSSTPDPSSTPLPSNRPGLGRRARGRSRTDGGADRLRCSPGVEGCLQRLQHPDHPDAGRAVGAWSIAREDAVDEVLALQP